MRNPHYEKFSSLKEERVPSIQHLKNETVWKARTWYALAMIEESNLIYHAEKNPELIGKDVSLIPWYISPKIAFLRGHTISFLRKIRISSLHSLGSTIRSFHISKPKPGQPFSDFEQSYEIEISNQAMMLKEISGLLIEEERKAGLPTLKERNKHNIPMTLPLYSLSTLEFFVNEMLVESNILWYGKLSPFLKNTHVELIPEEVDVRISFMGFEGIAQLRKTRLTTLHEIGSKLHSCDLKVFEESNAQARSEWDSVFDKEVNNLMLKLDSNLNEIVEAEKIATHTNG